MHQQLIHLCLVLKRGEEPRVAQLVLSGLRFLNRHVLLRILREKANLRNRLVLEEVVLLDA